MKKEDSEIVIKNLDPVNVEINKIYEFTFQINSIFYSAEAKIISIQNNQIYLSSDHLINFFDTHNIEFLESSIVLKNELIITNILALIT